jgi:diguanylate cyclase (GGDEF)-like protein/PAS domain S-box-containing protein
MFRVFNCIATEHDWRLIVVAGLVCFLASLAAITLLDRARSTQGRVRTAWIITAGTATGCGIWATHFIAMLAYDPGVVTAYDLGLTALSLLAAVSVTSAGLALAVNGPARWGAAAGGGLVGAGVAVMHYLGMWALLLPGRVTWDPELVFVSVVLGIAFGIASLTIAMRRRGLQWNLLAAALLTLAIVSHHFTAMGAVTILPDPTRAIDALSLAPNTLALAIAAAAVSILGICLVGAWSDRRSEAMLREQNRRLDAALNNMSQGLLMYDAAGRLLVCNDRYIEMYGLSREVVKPGCTLPEILDHRWATGNLPGDPATYAASRRAAAAELKPTRMVLELADGRVIEVANQPMAGGGWVVTHEDVSLRTQAGKERDRTRAFLDLVIENVPATLVVKDAREHRYVLVNRAAEEFFGMSREEMIGKNAHDLFPQKDADYITACDEESVRSGRHLFLEEHPVHTPRKGVRLMTSKRITIAGDDGQPQYLLGFLEDVTERRRAEAQIAHLAHHDPLTTLPNRAAFNECLAFTIERTATAGGSFALLFLDLDRFKEVNDVFGHSVGDALLSAVAGRLQTAAEGAFLGRLGGDEFIVIVDGPQPGTAEALAERLLGSTEGLVVKGHPLSIGLTIGVAVFPNDGTDAATLLANADAALYRAKAEARGSIRFFEPDMDKRLRDRRALQQELRFAIDRGELAVHYQPQARIDRDVIGFEALARWQHPRHGAVPPAAFIPLAEESGLILPVGEWILREACREAASWANPLQIAINLSPVQFQHGDLPGLVHAVLLETGLAPSRLELEITEGVLIGDFSRALSILRRLKALGVRIAMDDFGTGYSSLSYLQSFPFDKIKIDRSFISNLDHNAQAAAIIRAVIGLARGLDLPIVAEGVETESQLMFLAGEACDEIQGYLIGRPRVIEAYAELTRRPAALQQMAAAG